MSSSKSPISADVKVPCIDCGRECPDGLRYCLYCGGKTLEIDKPLMPMNPHCAECGEVDELNITFCVACGAKLLYAYDGTGSNPAVVPGGSASSASAGSSAAGSSRAVPAAGNAAFPGAATAGKFRRNTGFNWTKEITAPGGRNASKTPLPPQAGGALLVPGEPSLQQTRKQSSMGSVPGLVPIAAGVAVGVVIVGALYGTGFLPDLFDRVAWPKSGLVVYCPLEDLKPITDPEAGTKTSSTSSETASDKTTDSSSDSATAAAPSGDDNKQAVSGPDDDTKSASAVTASDSSNSGSVNSDSASSTKGSDRPEDGGIWQVLVENLDNHQLTISPIKPPRTILGRRVPGYLVFKDLAAGSYMLRIHRPGSATTFGMVTLVADKPTVIGYPGGMKLPI